VNPRSTILFAGIVLIFLASATPGYAEDSNEQADARAGAILFRDKGCAYCHGAGGIGTKKAPSLVDIRQDKQWPPQRIADQILNGGKTMPPFRDALSDQEIQQLVAYLRAKDRPSPPSPDSAATPPSH